MSFLSGLSNIFHGIGHVFDAHDDEQKKRDQAQQQQQQQQQSQPRIVHPQPVQNHQPIAPVQQQAPQPLNTGQGVYQGGGPQAGSFDPNAPLIKAMAAQALAQPVDQPHPQQAQQHHSILHNIVHGALTGAKDVGSVAAGTSLGVLRAGEGLVEGVTSIPDQALHLGHWMGDTFTGEHTDPGWLKKADSISDTLQSPLKWTERKTDEAANAYGGPGAAVYKPVQVAANVATLVPAGAALLTKADQIGHMVQVGDQLIQQGGNLGKVGEAAGAVTDFVKGQKAASPALQLLEKAKTGLVNRYEEVNGIHGNPDVAGPSKPSVEAGVKSANPNQAQDAAAQAAAAAPPPPEPLPAIQEHALNDHEQAALTQLNKDAKTRVLSDEENNMRAALQDKSDTIDVANNPQSLSPATTGRATRSSKSQPSQPQNTPATTNSTAGAAPTKVSATPGPSQVSPQSPPEPTATPSKVSSKSPVTSDTVPQTSSTGKTAKNAPNVRDQFEKELQSAGAAEDKAGKAHVGRATEHNVLSNEDLNAAAKRAVESTPDEELVKNYATGAEIRSAADVAKGYASIPRLAKLAKAGNEDAKTAIENIIEGAEKHVSTSGRTLNYAGSMYDALPKEAKVSYLLRNIDRVRTSNGLDPLADDVKAAADKEINDLLTKSELSENAAAKAQGDIDKILEKARAGEATPDEIQKIADLQRKATDADLAVQKLNTDVARAYDKLAPAKKNVESVGKDAGDLGRSLMLTSVSGRVSDVATTAINATHSLLQSSGEALIGKVANKISGTPGKYIDTMPSLKAIWQGTKTGAQKAAGNYKGDIYSPDALKAIRSGNMGGKTQLLRQSREGPLNKVRNFAHAMAETATNLSDGVKNAHILQMAYQEGKQAGLKGVDLDVYAHGRAAVPSHVMEANGQKLVDEINNMNDNPLTAGMEKISKAFSGDEGKAHGLPGQVTKAVGEQIRNITVPFTRWVAGQAWNGVTDKNAVANVIRGARAIAKGDAQEAAHQAAGLAVNTAGSMSAGYALAQSGMLTTRNAEGFNDDGLYIHLGGHYIPVGFMGFFAPGMIMGWATHQALHDPNAKGIGGKITDIAGTTMGAMARSYMSGTIIGGTNEFLKQTQEAFQNKEATFGDAAVTGATEAAGDYIPGVMGDVNTAINTFNIGGLNPNHEAAITKVTKGQSGQLTKSGDPSTAKDIPASDINKLINRVPVLGQKDLPRNPGVAANDFGSRITRGDNESSEQSKITKALSTLPSKAQDEARKALVKTDGAAQYAAQKAADVLTGPSKVKAQQTADKMKFAGKDIVENTVKKSEQSEEQSKFTESGKEIQTIGDKTYANVNGNVRAYDTPQKAQQALDLQKFTDSGAKSLSKNGMVYERGSNGKVTSMEQKDADYKSATEQISSAKNSGDVSGYVKGHQDLLGNISWQLNHADLTPENRAALVQKAVQSEEEIAKTQWYKGFDKPKGVDAYSTPEITGAREYTPDEQKQYGGAKGYVPVIQEMGAKHGVDINALLSVAAVEGLGGGVGDGGHAFGPFQMNDAGGVLKGKFKTSAEAKAYAESPAGIEDAVKQIAAVAKGKTGEEAIKAIVNQFERPADPNGEIAKALALYSGGKITLTPDGGSNLTPNDASGSSAADKAKTNTIGSVHQMKELNFTGLAPQKITDATIPTIQAIKSGDLIKQRAITVSKVR